MVRRKMTHLPECVFLQLLCRRLSFEIARTPPFIAPLGAVKEARMTLHTLPEKEVVSWGKKERKMKGVTSIVVNPRVPIPY